MGSATHEGGGWSGEFSWQDVDAGRLLPGHAAGWRSSQPGRQTIRLLFADPQPLKRIWLQFRETGTERTQEYVLRHLTDGADTMREIVRQQWNFSPGGATTEIEDHGVDLPAVKVLELSINPDIGGKSAIASLVLLSASPRWASGEDSPPRLSQIP